MALQSEYRWGRAAREFCAGCEALLSEVQGLTYEELRTLDHPGKEFMVRGRVARAGVIVESNNPDGLLVVVLGSMPSRFIPFLSDCFADGFCIRPDGTKRELTLEEMREYD